jgi:hypothetical protein
MDLTTALGFYTLDGHEPVPVTDTLAWAAWMHTADRHVARSCWGDADGRELARVSTVFLGLDHSWAPPGHGGPPVLFETMVFAPGHRLDQYQWRHTTWDEAAAEHERTRAILAQHYGDEQGGQP